MRQDGAPSRLHRKEVSLWDFGGLHFGMRCHLKIWPMQSFRTTPRQIIFYPAHLCLNSWWILEKSFKGTWQGAVHERAVQQVCALDCLPNYDDFLVF